jgi:hypothetical protein
VRLRFLSRAVARWRDRLIAQLDVQVWRTAPAAPPVPSVAEAILYVEMRARRRGA